MKIGGVDERSIAVRADRKTFVNGAFIGVIYGNDGLVQIHSGIPSADNPVLGIEDEKSAA